MWPGTRDTGQSVAAAFDEENAPHLDEGGRTVQPPAMTATTTIPPPRRHPGSLRCRGCFGLKCTGQLWITVYGSAGRDCREVAASGVCRVVEQITMCLVGGRLPLSIEVLADAGQDLERLSSLPYS